LILERIAAAIGNQNPESKIQIIDSLRPVRGRRPAAVGAGEAVLLLVEERRLARALDRLVVEATGDEGSKQSDGDEAAGEEGEVEPRVALEIAGMRQPVDADGHEETVDAGRLRVRVARAPEGCRGRIRLILDLGFGILERTKAVRTARDSKRPCGERYGFALARNGRIGLDPDLNVCAWD